MKLVFIIGLLVISVLACTSHSKTAEKQEEIILEVPKVVEPQQKTEKYNDTEASLQEEQLINNTDSTLHVLCDTSYFNQDLDTIMFQKIICPFKPSFLVVTNGKLELSDSNIDSIYRFNIQGEVYTATWSLQNKRELFLLVKSSKELSDKDSIEFPFLAKNKLYDLILYRANLDSMKMYRVAKLYNESTKLYRLHYELSDFFPRESIIKIDTLRNKIFYDAIDIMEDPMWIVPKSTYEIDLNTGKVMLTELVHFNQMKDQGKSTSVYTNSGYSEKDNYSARVGLDSLTLYGFGKGDDSLLIRKEIFHANSQMKLDELKVDTVIKNLQFNFAYTKNPNFILGSPFSAYEMGELIGEVLLMDRDSLSYRRLLNRYVIGYNIDYQIKNNMNLFKTYWDLEIYDSLFQQKKKFIKVPHYEFQQ